MNTTPQAALLSEIMQALNIKEGVSTSPRLATVEGWKARYDALQATQADHVPETGKMMATQAEPVQAGELPDERLSRVTKGTLSIARDAIEYEKGIAHKQGYKQGYQQGKEDERQRALAARKPLTPLTPAQMEKGRDQIFSINNPFCPCDSKTFRKVAEWVERHHGIGLEVKP